MEREDRSFTEANAYFDRIFKNACELVAAVNLAVREDEETANASLPFDSVRVQGVGERSALVKELSEYTRAAWNVVLQRVEKNGGTIDHESICQIILPQLFLAFMAGYKHFAEEVEIPLFSIEGRLPDGPTV